MHRILIADDEPRMRQRLKQIVARLAGAVYEASDGGEAIAICAAEGPDGVLMDPRMKPIDGLRATAVIKAHFPETRVVIVTQYDDAELRAEALRVGATCPRINNTTSAAKRTVSAALGFLRDVFGHRRTS